MEKPRMQDRRTHRIQVQLTEDELALLDKWRFGNSIPSRAAAIRDLIRIGLADTSDRDEPASRRKSTDYGLEGD